MKIPKTVSILGTKWTVLLEDHHPSDSDCFGETNGMAHTCTVYKKTHERWPEYSSVQSTLFHELIHAALETSGANALLTEKTEEAIVIAIEKALFPLVKSGLFK